VPFYRDIDEDTEQDFEEYAKTPFTQRGLSGQSAQVKKLLGSELKTKDLLSNILMRQLKFVDAAMKNKAMVEVVGNLDGSKYLERVKPPVIMPSATPSPSALPSTGLSTRLVACCCIRR